MRTFFSIVALLVCVAGIAEKKRVALIIGNEEYNGHFSTLYTPVNDAEAMANVLYALGFDTIVGKNVRREDMSIYLDKFHARSNGADLALLYYSGHAGIANGDQFYIAPSGTYRRLATLTADCYPFSNIKNEISRIGSPLKIVIIDACRNSIDDNKSRIRSFTPEIVTKKNSKEIGTVYWFATGVNQIAKTGSGKYSLFTASLLNHIGDFDNLEIVQKRVNEEVTRSDNEQVPYYSDNSKISPNIYLNPQKIRIHSLILEGKEYFSIVTTPSDATISVDGKKHKSGEPFILELGKDYDISISAEGYATYNKKITANTYKTSYNVTLDELAEARLDLLCNVNGAKVYFDGKEIGFSPVYNIQTYAGLHDVRLEKKGYYSYNASPILKGGSQTHYANIRRHYPWFISWDDDELGIFSYHYSPNYPIGLDFMYRPDFSRFSYGVIGGLSFGLFKGWEKVVPITNNSFNIDENEIINNSKHYDAFALLLANGGFNIINGIMLETGVGAAYHQDIYHYDQQFLSMWYRRNTKWSPAIRVGAKILIPIDTYDDNTISIGGGYTYLTNNNKYSSWDVNIGISF